MSRRRIFKPRKAQPPAPPDDLDRLIQEAITQLGFDVDATQVARSVKLLNLGLPAEDEFSAICAWLGRCELVHKLDQLQAPTSSHDAYQVPDLLVAFASHGAVLIEVKVRAKTTLSFRPDYLRRLQAYAQLLGKPLLIAWKYFNIWTLFDARHLTLARTNYNISLNEALRQNLLGALAGDVVFKLCAGAGLHLTIAKEELLSTTPTESGCTEEWQMRIVEVAFSKGGGARVPDLHPETQQLLIAWDLEQKEIHHADRIEMGWVAGEEGMQFAHMALVRLLSWGRAEGSKQDWRATLRAPRITEAIENFGAALERALTEGVVQFVMHQQPVDVPDFLTEAEA